MMRPAENMRADGCHGCSAWIFPVLTISLVAVLGLSLGLGAINVPPPRIWTALVSRATAADSDVTIIWHLRLPRALLAAAVGAALAASGAGFQGLFRNPLADPFVIGASSGAAFGATLAIILGFDALSPALGAVPLAAFVGALAAVLVAYLIAGAGRGSSVGTLLLAGSALGTMLTAFVSFLMISGEQPWFQVFNWILGGFSGRSWPHLWIALPHLLLAIVGLWVLARPLDALVGGDDAARSLGLRIRTARIAIVAAASLATAVSVAVAGIIGFVGLIAPHAARLLIGGGHRRLIPASALLGAILMVAADAVARSALAPLEVPVGIITALMGGPFFLVVLRTWGTRIT